MANTRMRGPGADHGERVLLAESSVAKLSFRRADVPAVRRFAAEFGTRAGLGPARLSDFVLAVSEAAACAVSHGPCTARLRLWTTGARVFGEIRSDGMLLGHGPRAVEQGDAEAMRRRLLQRICDHAGVETGPYGVTARFSFSIA
jgi:hypothetical protein